jgi:transposase
MPKSNSPRFRARAVELCRAGASPSKIAQDLRISEATIYRWVAQDEIDPGERPGTPSGERAELSKARSRIKELEAELELTRKASALFDGGEERPAQKDLPGDRRSGRAETQRQEVLPDAWRGPHRGFSIGASGRRRCSSCASSS